MHLLCRYFGHRRSKRHAWPVAGAWRSWCRRCGTYLIRVAPKTWEVLPPPGSESRAIRTADQDC